MPGNPTAPIEGVPDALMPSPFAPGLGNDTGFLVGANVCPYGDVIFDKPAVADRVGNGGRKSPSSMEL